MHLARPGPYLLNFETSCPYGRFVCMFSLFHFCFPLLSVKWIFASPVLKRNTSNLPVTPSWQGTVTKWHLLFEGGEKIDFRHTAKPFSLKQSAVTVFQQGKTLAGSRARCGYWKLGWSSSSRKQLEEFLTVMIACLVLSSSRLGGNRKFLLS